MVKVREHHPMEGDHSLGTGTSWVANFCSRFELDDSYIQPLQNAVLLAQEAEHNQALESTVWATTGSSYFIGLEMAEILAELRIDLAGLQAAIVYRSVREQRININTVRARLGDEVALLVEKVLQMAVISALHNSTAEGVFGQEREQQAIKVREMLVSIIDDVRLALIKLAERTCAIRGVKTAPEARRLKVAREVFEIYAPLAHRLGIGHIKWELEDLAFRYLEADTYKQIAKLLHEKRLERQHYIESVKRVLTEKLHEANIDGTVSGRAKHIYSIWRKMQRKDIGFSQVYDIRAVRILVPTVRDCYTILGVVHGMWRHIPNEFDDYIAAPKENGYRSLHTAVIGPERKIVEIQIRTQIMHDEAELGICSHWRYKGSDAVSAAASYENKIEWLRQVLDWHEELAGTHQQGDFRLESSHERVYVFTPDGHVVDLPELSTPLDFAYRVHTDIGHRCRGAKINGKMLPLTTKLRTGDQVEIITSRTATPSRDWLVPSYGFIKTSRARAKIQQWFRKQNYQENLLAGKQLLDRELGQLGFKNYPLDHLAERFNKVGAEGLYAAIGAGDVGVEQTIKAIQSELAKQLPDVPLTVKTSARQGAGKVKVGRTDVYIQGVGNLLTQIANCCHPLPGESITGYVTQGRGVSIHRSDCGNLLRLQSKEPERIIRVAWGGAPVDRYPVKLLMDVFDRSGLVLDVAKVVDKQGLNIISFNSCKLDSDEDMARIDFVVEVAGLEQLSGLMGKLRQLPNVIEIKRVTMS